MNNKTEMIMEIMNVEASTFEAMMTKFEAFAERVEKLCQTGGDI